MTVSGELFDYSYDGTTYEGYRVHPGGGDKPVVLVCHAWGGQQAFEREQADKLAEMGYAALAVDVYGKGKRGSTPEEATALMNPLVEDRAQLQARLGAAIDVARGLEGVDASRVAAIGFCFGGLCVLDIARMGADLKGVVSFHGLLGAAPNIPSPQPKAKALVLHGWDDPLADPDSVLAFSKEMTEGGADWQLIAYGHTVHAFTNPGAQDKANGMGYDPVITRRAWAATTDFLAEVFGD